MILPRLLVRSFAVLLVPCLLMDAAGASDGPQDQAGLFQTDALVSMAVGAAGYVFNRKKNAAVQHGMSSALPLENVSGSAIPLGKVKGWPVPILSLPAYSHHVNQIAWSPDSQELASGGSEGHVTVYQMNGGVIGTSLQGSGNVLALAFSNAGNLLAAGGSQSSFFLNPLLVWRKGPDGKWLEKGVSLINDPSEGNILSLTFSPDDQFLAAGTSNGGVRLFRKARDGEFQLVKRIEDLDSVQALQFSPDSRRLAIGPYGAGRMYVLNLTLTHKGTGAKLQELPVHGFDGHLKVSWSPTGRELIVYGTEEDPEQWAVSDHKHVVLLWELGPDGILSVLPRKLTGLSNVYAMTWLPEDRGLLGTGNTGNNAVVWTRASNGRLQTHGEVLSSPLGWAHVSPNGEIFLAMGGPNMDFQARAMGPNFELAGPVLSFSGPETTYPVGALGWSPNGRRFAVGHGNGKLFVFEIAEALEAIHRERDLRDDLSDAEFVMDPEIPMDLRRAFLPVLAPVEFLYRGGRANDRALNKYWFSSDYSEAWRFTRRSGAGEINGPATFWVYDGAIRTHLTSAGANLSGPLDRVLVSAQHNLGSSTPQRELVEHYESLRSQLAQLARYTPMHGPLPFPSENPEALNEIEIDLGRIIQGLEAVSSAFLEAYPEIAPAQAKVFVDEIVLPLQTTLGEARQELSGSVQGGENVRRALVLLRERRPRLLADYQVGSIAALTPDRVDPADILQELLRLRSNYLRAQTQRSEQEARWKNAIRIQTIPRSLASGA